MNGRPLTPSQDTNMPAQRSSLVYDREIKIGEEVTVTFSDTSTLTGVLRFYYPNDQIWVIQEGTPEAPTNTHYVKDFWRISKIVP